MFDVNCESCGAWVAPTEVRTSDWGEDYPVDFPECCPVCGDTLVEGEMPVDLFMSETAAATASLTLRDFS